MKYIDRIKKSQEEQLTEAQEYLAEDNKDQLEADLKATSRALKEEKRTLEDLKSAAQLDSGKILNSQDKIEGLQKGVKALDKLIKELF